MYAATNTAYQKSCDFFSIGYIEIDILNIDILKLQTISFEFRNTFRKSCPRPYSRPLWVKIRAHTHAHTHGLWTPIGMLSPWRSLICVNWDTKEDMYIHTYIHTNIDNSRAMSYVLLLSMIHTYSVINCHISWIFLVHWAIGTRFRSAVRREQHELACKRFTKSIICKYVSTLAGFHERGIDPLNPCLLNAPEIRSGAESFL